jgi:hypothetical protein
MQFVLVYQSMKIRTCLDLHSVSCIIAFCFLLPLRLLEEVRRAILRAVVLKCKPREGICHAQGPKITGR